MSGSGKSCDVRDIHRLPPTRQACSIISADTIRFDPRNRASTILRLDSKTTPQWRPVRLPTVSRPSKPVRYAVAIQSRHRELHPFTPLGQARSICPAQFKLDEASLASCTVASKPAPIRPVNSAPSVGCKVAQTNLVAQDRSSRFRHTRPFEQARPIRRVRNAA